MDASAIRREGRSTGAVDGDGRESPRVRPLPEGSDWGGWRRSDECKERPAFAGRQKTTSFYRRMARGVFRRSYRIDSQPSAVGCQRSAPRLGRQRAKWAGFHRLAEMIADEMNGVERDAVSAAAETHGAAQACRNGRLRAPMCREKPVADGSSRRGEGWTLAGWMRRRASALRPFRTCGRSPWAADRSMERFLQCSLGNTWRELCSRHGRKR